MTQKWVKILDRYGMLVMEGHLMSRIESRDDKTITLKIKDYPTVCDICEPVKIFKTHHYWKKHMKKVHEVEVK